MMTQRRKSQYQSIFLLADMMTYKKKKLKRHANYRALGLLNHTYKVFASILLLRILPYIAPKYRTCRLASERNEDAVTTY